MYGDPDAANTLVWHCPIERGTLVHNVMGEPDPDGAAVNVTAPVGVAPEAVTVALYTAV